MPLLTSPWMLVIPLALFVAAATLDRWANTWLSVPSLYLNSLGLSLAGIASTFLFTTLLGWADRMGHRLRYTLMIVSLIAGMFILGNVQWHIGTPYTMQGTVIFGLVCAVGVVILALVILSYQQKRKHHRHGGRVRRYRQPVRQA